MINLVETLIHKLSQELGPAMDPNQVQQGQSVYDQAGEEFVILENDPTTTNKVLMPAEDKAKEIPEGATTVDDSEFSTNYQVQPNQTLATIEKEFVKGLNRKSS